MQKVVCPTMIVQIDSRIPPYPKKEWRATPVMMPGSASGSTNRKLTASRPKNAVLRIAKAAHDPSTSASAVVVSATSTESRSADTTSASLMVILIHVSVRPSIGQASIFDELNA